MCRKTQVRLTITGMNPVADKHPSMGYKLRLRATGNYPPPAAGLFDYAFPNPAELDKTLYSSKPYPGLFELLTTSEFIPGGFGCFCTLDYRALFSVPS